MTLSGNPAMFFSMSLKELDYLDEFIAAGVSPEQAKLHIRLASEVNDRIQADLVTKNDLEVAKKDIELEIAKVNASIEELKKDLTLKLGAMMIAGFGLTITVLSFIIKS